MIRFFVELIYKYKFVRIALKYLFSYSLFIYVIGIFLNYYFTEEIDLNFFNWGESFNQNPLAIILILVSITFIFLIVILYFYYQINVHKKVKIKLEDIAYLWTNEIEEEEIRRIEYNHSNFLIRSINDKKFKNVNLQRFNSERIIVNLKYFCEEELYLISSIMGLLDDNSKVSSVPTMKADSENSFLGTLTYFKQYNTRKTNFELLSEIKLIEHTINVVEETIKEFEKEEINDGLKLSTIIIAALSHDIGKIKDHDLLKEIGLDDVIVEKYHHSELSTEYFKGLVTRISYYDHKEEVIKAIKEHHSSVVPADRLSKLIFIGDKNARKVESKFIIDKFKAEEKEQKEKAKAEEKEQNDSSSSKSEDLEKEYKILVEKLKKYEETKDDIKEEIAEKIETKPFIRTEENDEDEENSKLEAIVNVIKDNLNTYTKRGFNTIYKDKDLIDKPKEYLKSITDDKYIYLTYSGLREIFETVEHKKLTFEEMTNHKFINLLKKFEVIHFYDESQYYKKFNLVYQFHDEEQSKEISLIKISIEKINLDLEEVIQEKKESVMKNFYIKNI